MMMVNEVLDMAARRNPDDAVNVFNYTSSLDYILDVIKSKGHGFKAAISKSTGCQSAYVSRVLAEKAHFSLEQAERLTELFLLTEPEAHYFMTLVQRDRAGTKELKTYFTKQMNQLKTARLNLKNRVAAPSEISESDRHTYYSSWVYGAVYVMTSIPKFQNAESISHALGLPVRKVVDVLEFLSNIGLVTGLGGKYQISGASLHLEKDSPHIVQHHMNWRTRAMHSVEASDPEELHYSLVMSLSKADAETIKAKLADLVEEVNRLLLPSKEEEVHVLTIDYFGLR